MLKLGKITSGFTLTKQWETGNYHIIFWSMTSKAEFSGESGVHFLYIFSIYVATTHLTTKFYKKMEEIYKNRSSLSLIDSAFAVTDPKTMVVTSLSSLGQGETKWDFSKLQNANYTMKKIHYRIFLMSSPLEV